MVVYQCFNKYFSKFCNVPEETVVKLDDKTFYMINHLESILNNDTILIPTCKGNKNESRSLCHPNGIAKVTWIISMELTVIFALYSNVFNTNFQQIKFERFN